ncbi:hypothetical protein MD484_g958, partial [Candolleomyces efflorescens]
MAELAQRAPEPETQVLALGSSCSPPDNNQPNQPTPSSKETGSKNATLSMFSNAHHFNVGNIQINSTQHVSNARDGNTAPNAFYDSGARFDPPKCDEDTRVGVIGEVMDWIKDRDSPQRLLCLTGSAGAGKSALQQTIAERCADSGILGSAVFFSSQDPTRNNLSRIIPTIACQLGQHDSALQDCIRQAIEKDPLIFTKTAKIQMDILIVRSFQQFSANGNSDTGNFPHAILIDGLDECSREAQQAEFLSSIKSCLLDNDLPFRIFLASRPEWAIRSALNSEPQGYLYELAYHIRLGDKYDATDDIRRYLWRRLRDIGSRSHDPRARSQSWPSKEDIEKLVVAASGQFVYAATVVNYLSERRTGSSPVDKLQTIVDWTPEESHLERPFEALDTLYAGILSAAKDLYEAVDTNRKHNFLLLLRAHHINSDYRVNGGRWWSADTFDQLLNLPRGTHEVLVADLHSLVECLQLPGYPLIKLRFHHRSFSEFLDSEVRAKSLYISGPVVRQYVLGRILRGMRSLSSQRAYSTVGNSYVLTFGARVSTFWTYFKWSLVLASSGEDPDVSTARVEDTPTSVGASTSTSMFSGARHFNVGGIHIDSSQHVHHGRDKPSIDGWEILLDKIAANAFYDSAARFDPPKCDEDTRVDVIGEIMDWVNDRTGPQRLLCMTGAAGAGKSALQQTIAERCSDSGILGCAFFFSSQDPTRNDLSRIVPTIACQLGQHDPTLQDYIRKAIERDRLIFTKTLRVQMDTLIVRPFQQFSTTGIRDPSRFPHLILIDGLDECSGEDKQAELLACIKHGFLDNDLPFRIFLASRPEWAVRSALDSEPQGYLHQFAYHIQLSDKYDATEDIRRYLWRRLWDIGSRSHDPVARSPSSWPSAAIIEKLVVAASGQFVYAATVVKYVSERRSSPVDRLQTVVDWTPEKGELARPFEALDALYTNILSAAKELYEAVDSNHGRNFLLLLRAHHINDGRVGGLSFNAPLLNTFLGLERGAHDVLVSDLHSLVRFCSPYTPRIEMRFYHESFREFLASQTRAKDLFVPETEVRAHVLKAVVQKFTLHSNSGLSREVLVALVLYSNEGEDFDGQQLLALAHNDAWRKIDQLVVPMIPADTFTGYISSFLEMIGVLERRLKDELKEAVLADELGAYGGKWRGLME